MDGTDIWWAVGIVAALVGARYLVHWYNNRRMDELEGKRYDED